MRRWSLALLAAVMSASAGAAAAPPDELGEYPFFDDGLVTSLMRPGLGNQAAAQALARAPDATETLVLLAEQRRSAPALRVLRTIVDRHPDRIAQALELLEPHSSQFIEDPSRGYREFLVALVQKARVKTVDLPPEEAARATLQLLYYELMLGLVPRDDRRPRLDALIKEYPGTEAAGFAEIDRMDDADILRHIDELDGYARAHPGTVPGARARYLAGFQLHVNVAVTGLEPLGSDPTDRFLKVLAIVDDLESGRWPSCRWAEQAPSLIIEFFAAGQPSYAPGNLDRLLGGYERFVARHLGSDRALTWENGIGYLTTERIPELYALRGDPVAGMEGMFDRLERTNRPQLAEVRYLRALFYLHRAMKGTAAARDELVAKARRTLAASSTQGTDRYARVSLATLGAHYFHAREYQDAVATLRRYLAAYPTSPWAWVAALRIGQSQAELGDLEAAARTFASAGTTYEAVAPARVLGHARAAEAYEALARWDTALVEYRRARDGWDNDFGQWYLADPPVTRQALADAVARLERAAKLPGGAQLERGRWLVDRGRWDEAQEVLRPLAASSEARALLHRAQLLRALELAAIANPKRDVAAALRLLEELDREPFDFAVCAGGIARASLLGKQGAGEAARHEMRRALRRWAARARGKPSNDLEVDVTAIRDVVFRPDGGGIYAGHGRWNGFAWPVASPPYLVARSELSVKLSDGNLTRVAVAPRVPGMDNVLFVGGDDLELLSTIVARLGGTRTREPTGVMEVPNQPIGPSLDIVGLWNEFFPSRPGHWGGWVFETYPIITLVEFTDPARNSARAEVTVGYAGATVLLRKVDGTWRAIGLVNEWVT